MSIDFSTISASIRRPGQYVEFSSTNAVSGLAQEKRRILVIGQRLPTGTVAALVPRQIFTADQGVQFFGRGSMLAQMLKALDKTNTSLSEVWAIALDDLPAGVANVQTATVTGPATGSGTLALLIGDTPVPVGVTAGDTGATIATNIAAAINALPDLPLTAAAAAGVVTMTANHKGVCPGSVVYRVNYYQGDVTPAGVALARAIPTVGTGNPSLDTVWPVLGDVKYNIVITPYIDPANLTSVETELLSRWGGMRMIEGIGITAGNAPMSTAAALGASRNSPLVSILDLQTPSSPWALAAAYAGAIESSASIDPARPFTGLPLTGILAPRPTQLFDAQEQELLLHDGISTCDVENDGTVVIQRAITTYQENSYGLPDVAYLDLTTPLTLGYLRFSLRDRIATKFPRSKLADDGTPFGAGQPIVTPSIIRSEEIALAAEWADAGLVEDLDAFAKGLVVERNAQDRDRVDSLLPPNLVNQFLVFAGDIQFVL